MRCGARLPVWPATGHGFPGCRAKRDESTRYQPRLHHWPSAIHIRTLAVFGQVTGLSRRVASEGNGVGAADQALICLEYGRQVFRLYHSFNRREHSSLRFDRAKSPQSTKIAIINPARRTTMIPAPAMVRDAPPPAPVSVQSSLFSSLPFFSCASAGFGERRGMVLFAVPGTTGIYLNSFFHLTVRLKDCLAAAIWASISCKRFILLVL